MSVVIVGGNERMVCQYEDICKGFGCKAKVFAKEKGAIRNRSGDTFLLYNLTFLRKCNGKTCKIMNYSIK